MSRGIGHIIVGATGTGKTYLIKKMLNAVPNKHSIIVYDVNNEYSDIFPYPFMDFETFTQKAKHINKGVIVFEEATIFLNNRSCNREINELLVRKRHSLNYVVLVFHSMRSIPRYIYELCNYITVFKTNDSPDMTARELKDERIEGIMNEVKENKNPYQNRTLKIY